MSFFNRNSKLPEGWTIVTIDGWCYLRKDGPMVEYSTLGPDIRWPRVIGLSSAVTALTLLMAMLN